MVWVTSCALDNGIEGRGRLHCAASKVVIADSSEVDCQSDNYLNNPRRTGSNVKHQLM